MSIEKAKNVLSFHPSDDLRSIVMNLIDNMDKFQDWENPLYSNIGTFRGIESGVEIHGMANGALAMKIAVIGSNGQLGNDLAIAFSDARAMRFVG